MLHCIMVVVYIVHIAHPCLVNIKITKLSKQNTNPKNKNNKKKNHKKTEEILCVHSRGIVCDRTLVSIPVQGCTGNIF